MTRGRIVLLAAQGVADTRIAVRVGVSPSTVGRVTHDARERHTGADFLAFLERIARAYPQGEVHLALDNVSTHKTPAVQAWLAKHPCFQFHFTPTSASWMNQIETWFAILTRQAIRGGSFNSVQALVKTIDTLTREWNDRAAPTPAVIDALAWGPRSQQVPRASATMSTSACAIPLASKRIGGYVEHHA